MTRTEAEQIAKRIANVWRGGPATSEWIDALLPLDVGTAGTALARLRNELQHAPTIAQFLGKYRGLNTPANDPIGHGCSRCKHGWQTVYWDTDGNRVVSIDGEPPANTSNGVAPCDCLAGRRHQPLHTAILEHNRNELDRILGPGRHDTQEPAA